MEHAAAQHRTELTGLGRSLFEGAPAPLLLVDPDTDRILEANLRAATLLGRDSESLFGLSFADLLAGSRGGTSDREERRQRTAACLAAACLDAQQHSPGLVDPNPGRLEQPVWPTAEIRTEDGAAVIVELLISRAEGDEGSHFLVVLRDITQTRRGSEVERLFHDSPVSLWEFDWSRVRQKLDDWSRSGVGDLRA